MDERARHRLADESVTTDAMAYRLTVAGLSLALLAFIVVSGIAVSVGATVPDKFWLLGASIAGVLTGILLPSPTAPPKPAGDAAKAAATTAAPTVKGAVPNPPTATAKGGAWAQTNLRVVVLGAIFAVCGVAGLVLENTGAQGATQLFAVASAAGATALGILAPSPKSGADA
jgi:hypothetical protein